MSDSLAVSSSPVSSQWPPQDDLACHDDQFDHQLDRVPTGAGDDQILEGALTLKDTGEAYLRDLGASEDTARSALASLKETQVDPSKPFSTAEYSSAIPGASPEDTYRELIQHPKELFGAAGLTLHPPMERIAEGARAFIEDGTRVPKVSAPVEFHVDPHTRTVSIHTLEGHPLRGTNAFQVEPDGHGGSRLHQISEFQGSCGATHWLGVHVFGAMPRQHDIWKAVHGALACRMEQNRAGMP